MGDKKKTRHEEPTKFQIESNSSCTTVKFFTVLFVLS